MRKDENPVTKDKSLSKIQKRGIGFLAFGVAALMLLTLAMGSIGLIVGTIFTAVGLICLFSKKKTGMKSGWAVFAILFLFAASLNIGCSVWDMFMPNAWSHYYIYRTFMSLTMLLSAVIVFLVTGFKARKTGFENSKKQKSAILIAAVLFLIGFIPVLIGALGISNAPVNYELFSFLNCGHIVANILFILFTGVRLFSAAYLNAAVFRYVYSKKHR